MTRDGLPRVLGVWSSVALVVGITIGSGIFRTPATVARLVPHPLAALGLWTAGGLISLCGALSLAELAASLPEPGGYYVYLREGWGRPAAFLFGWSELVLIRASAVGGMALVVAEYALRSVGLQPDTHVVAMRVLSAAAIALAAAANVIGARAGAMVVSVSTAVKFAALALLVGSVAVLGRSHGASLEHLSAPGGQPLAIGGVGLALVAIFWTYDGWGDLSFAAGEVSNPQRTLPKAIVSGTLAIAGIYVLTNLAYLFVSPIGLVGRSPLIAADTMQLLFGSSGAVIVSALVTVSAFSSLNGSMLAAPRVFYAMASDGLFFRTLARVHPRFRTPYVAIGFAALLGMALATSQNFERLTSTFVLAIWPFYALTVGAVYRLRRIRPELPRPYRVGRYPPAIFIGAVVWFVVNALVNDTAATILTFVLILAGLPIYVGAFARRVT
jgi:amino acid transporter